MKALAISTFFIDLYHLLNIRPSPLVSPVSSLLFSGFPPEADPPWRTMYFHVFQLYLHIFLIYSSSIVFSSFVLHFSPLTHVSPPRLSSLVQVNEVNGRLSSFVSHLSPTFLVPRFSYLLSPLFYFRFSILYFLKFIQHPASRI